jgi:F0F1-type ATP synthase assembly protein I
VTREDPGWPTLLSMGTITAVIFAAGLALGWFADQLWDTFPIFALVGLALGIVGGICYTVVQFRSFLKE